MNIFLIAGITLSHTEGHKMANINYLSLVWTIPIKISFTPWSRQMLPHSKLSTDTGFSLTPTIRFVRSGPCPVENYPYYGRWNQPDSSVGDLWANIIGHMVFNDLCSNVISFFLSTWMHLRCCWGAVETASCLWTHCHMLWGNKRASAPSWVTSSCVLSIFAFASAFSFLLSSGCCVLQW